MTVSVSFYGFWPTFDPEDNFFKKALQDYFSNSEDVVVVGDPSSADFVIYTVFGNLNGVDTGKAKRIFFSGEANERYPNSNFYIDGDIFLGYNQTDLDKNTYRLPLWVTYINWWSPEDTEKISNLSKLQDPFKTLKRQHPCCIIASNPTSNRIEVALSINQNLFPVHGYGHVFGNPVPNDGQRNQDKLRLLENYIFNIAFENVNSVGYVTEKLYEAKFSGCIPIYWGTDWAKKDFNEDCFIYYNDFQSHEDSINYMKKLANSSSATEELASQPLFKEVPSLDGLYNFFDDIKLKG